MPVLLFLTSVPSLASQSTVLRRSSMAFKGLDTAPFGAPSGLLPESPGGPFLAEQCLSPVPLKGRARAGLGMGAQTGVCSSHLMCGTAGCCHQTTHNLAKRNIHPCIQHWQRLRAQKTWGTSVFCPQLACEHKQIKPAGDEYQFQNHTAEKAGEFNIYIYFILNRAGKVKWMRNLTQYLHSVFACPSITPLFRKQLTHLWQTPPFSLILIAVLSQLS